MAGRKRRASNSTVATVDDTHIRHQREASVLKPTSANEPDSEWPCYVLTDAVIYRKDGKTLANPLHVDLEGPMVVRGKLEVDEERVVQNLVRPNVKSAYIEISRSERYSIGYGPVTLWVSGAAGWFEIIPAPKYEAMYSQIQEAITLYYGVLDVYDQYLRACRKKQKKSKKTPIPPTLDDIFFKYAVTVGDGSVRDEVEARCHKWAQFFIAHFPKETDVTWEGTLFANWLHESHPDLKQNIADAAVGLYRKPSPPPVEEPQTLALPERPRSRSTRSSRQYSTHDEDTNTTDSAAIRQSRSPKGKAKAEGRIETPVPLPAQYLQAMGSKSSPAPTKESSPAAMDVPEAPIDRLLMALQDVAAEIDIQKCKAPRIHSTLFFQYKMRNYHAPAEITTHFSKQLLQQLGPEWRGTPFWTYLQSASKQPYKPPEHTKIEDMAPQLVPRKKKDYAPRLGARMNAPPGINLKPLPRTRHPVNEPPESADDEDLPPPPPQSSFVGKGRRKSGKGAVLRLASTSSKKRLASELDDDDDSGTGSKRGRKSLKTSHHQTTQDLEMNDYDDDNDEDEAGDENEVEVEVEIDDDELENEMKEGGGGGAAVRIVVRAERLPSTSPSGPNGTWTCEQEGCGYVVRSADEEEGQELIQEHFKDHEAQNEQVNLAMKEASRGRLPISHLLEKIQAIGKNTFLKKEGGTAATINGQAIPQPIKRRLLV
ncbi:hypothetical protein QBC46DRAFT_375569 [Diplogelasinospora grovesii]|uniref:Uncharacterized protein n=1 Tax=Diplogelasinospora grovesii TaxID=303347 RepID=A0AAN6NFI2_9PEZI|nr:hypothetical protein QBC46DRAFT_375569 [Diplogelasinospora grovesii]